jgi:hypothetical protein
MKKNQGYQGNQAAYQGASIISGGPPHIRGPAECQGASSISGGQQHISGSPQHIRGPTAYQGASRISGGPLHIRGPAAYQGAPSISGGQQHIRGPAAYQGANSISRGPLICCRLSDETCSTQAGFFLPFSSYVYGASSLWWQVASCLYLLASEAIWVMV